MEKIKKQEAVQEWTNLLKFIENKLYIPDTFILKTKYSIFNDYYNKMLKADFLCGFDVLIIVIHEPLEYKDYRPD